MRLIRHLSLVPFVVTAGPASAHSPLPGIEGFYTGILHPFSTPAQAFLIVGLGVQTASFTVDKMRWALLAFVIASLTALIFGADGADLDVQMFLIALVASGLMALCPGKAVIAVVGLAVAGGVCVGLASIPDPGPRSDRLFTMSGAFVGASLGYFYTMGAVHFLLERYNAPWVSLAVRIAAAWLGAVALLMVALRFAPVPPVS